MAEPEKLVFSADAAIIARLGQELVAKQETALIELIKNAFDADATTVTVTFLPGENGMALEIVDDGSGMSREDIISGFLRLATHTKIVSPRSPRFGRARAGKKGIGRFATQRLGRRLILTTSVLGSSTAHRLSVDWTQFTQGRSLDQVEVELSEVPKTREGTGLRIEDLRDSWSLSQIRQSWRGVLALQQPFPVAPVDARPNADPGFSVQMFQENSLFGDETLVANIQTEILDHLHAVIELTVKSDGLALWRIAENKLGDATEWAPIHHAYREGGSPVPYKVLRNIWMRAHYVVLAPDLLPNFVYTRLRDVLSEEGGIRLYRNGFRVVPYGDPDNDWLGLDATYARRSVLSPIANRNFFGIIEARDDASTLFEENTSREGLIENDALVEMKALVSSVLITAATKIAQDRGRKPRAGTKPKATTTTPLDEIERAVRSARETIEIIIDRPAASDTKQELQIAADGAAQAEALILRKKQEFETAQAVLADEAAMLRFLATLGMTVAEFSHETGMSFDAFRLDFESVFSVAIESRSDDKVFLEQATRARGMLGRLDTLTSYLNHIASARSARRMEEQSLRKAVQQFYRGVIEQARSQQIDITLDIPSYDPLNTVPMHAAEISSVLLNFYTNAVKAMKRTSNQRKIKVIADRLERPDGSYVRLRFLDTGDGIPVQNRDQVFDPFFTTSSAPSSGADEMEYARGSGLGLWISAQVATNAGGNIAVTDPFDGYSTCIEMTLRGSPAE